MNLPTGQLPPMDKLREEAAAMRPPQGHVPPQGGTAPPRPSPIPQFQRLSDAQRQKNQEIFGPYSDGARERYWDPEKVHCLMGAALDGKPNEVLNNCASPLPEVRAEAQQQAMNAIIIAFELVPFDPATGEGMTWARCKALWNQFHDWLEKKKANADGLPIGSELPASGPPISTSDSPTQQTTPMPPASSAATFTASPWGSHSTSGGCGCSDPQPSLAVPKSPPVINPSPTPGSMPSRLGRNR